MSQATVAAAAAGVAALLNLLAAGVSQRLVNLGGSAALAGEAFNIYGTLDTSADASSANRVLLVTNWIVPPGSTPQLAPNVSGWGLLLAIRPTAGAAGSLYAGGAAVSPDGITSTALPAVNAFLGAPIATNGVPTRLMLDKDATASDSVIVYVTEDASATDANGCTQIATLTGGGAYLDIPQGSYFQIKTVAKPVATSLKSAPIVGAAASSGTATGVSSTGIAAIVGATGIRETATTGNIGRDATAGAIQDTAATGISQVTSTGDIVHTANAGNLTQSCSGTMQSVSTGAYICGSTTGTMNCRATAGAATFRAGTNVSITADAGNVAVSCTGGNFTAAAAGISLAASGVATITGGLGASIGADMTDHQTTIGNTTGASPCNIAVGTGGLGVNASPVAATALMELQSTTRGFLPPRMTTAQRDAISSPATGLFIYNTTTNKLNVYTGSAWEAVTSS